MKPVEVKAREFHRRTAWALKTARKGTPVIIVSRHEPTVTLQLGRPEKLKAEASWEAHFTWLREQPLTPTNPVDDLRELERR